MKKVLSALAVIMVLCLTSCGTNNGAEDPNVYYVKYTYSMVPQSGVAIESRKLVVTYKDADGEKKYETTQRSGEITIGPVKKGFKSYLRTERTYGGVSGDLFDLYLYVNRNSEPFTLKDSRHQKMTCSVGYTIDF